MSKTRLVTGATLAMSGLLLSGCGSASLGVSPGVAAQVGDETLSARDVDGAAARMCTALGEQFKAESTTLPMSFVRQGTIQLLTLRAQAGQIADQYGIEPGTSYLDAVAQQQRTAATLPEEVQDTYVELTSANALVNDIVEQVGAIVLADAGVTDPPVEAVSQAGADVFNQWPDANGIDIDPRYGLKSIDGVLTPIDTNTSFAVSERATAGLSGDPDAAYARTLPLTHRCG